MIDLDFILPDTADDLEALEFQPSDEDLGIELPGDDTGEGDMGDVGGGAE